MKMHEIFDKKHKFKIRKARILRKKELLRILVFIFIINSFLMLAYFYPKLTGKAVELIQVNITRVIDGDTFEGGISKVRLLGVNSPEKGELGYEEAKDYLLNYEGKEIDLEAVDKDKYGRTLGYVYYNDKFVNSKILELGLASLYVYEKDKHYSELQNAEEQARKQELGIWKKSNNYGCISLVELKYEETERCNNEEQLIIKNICASIDAVLKDDATHIYNIKLENGNFVKNFSCIWNDKGDSVYLWDEDGLLLFYRYD